ncbi:hypothetical protein DM860_006115 [Cuscuta australis]|uniref:FAF domain-containing protein n=1 Tax=Cuscuta australis TaxID=267555 RepID=A0A328DP33_9ASTE|nr:hypothetical protein DM860_006115 [Cuscuta australis]
MPPRASSTATHSFPAAHNSPPPPLPPPAKKPREGISSILGSESDHRAMSAPAAASIRRTLSADMSSKNWLSHNGFSAAAPAADDHRPGQDEIWRAIQTQKTTQPNNDAIKPPATPLIRSSESFSSIVSTASFQSTEDPFSPSLLPAVEKKPPKKMSLQSLQICTEILCSETGAEDFSPDFPIEYPDDTERTTPLKNRYSKRAPPKPLPPPLPSLNLDKNSVQILPRRQNGRLTLEAVSLPPQEYLRAERRDGRLLIVLVNKSSHHETEEDNNKLNKETEEEETELVFNDFEEEEIEKRVKEEDDDEEEKEEEKNIMEVMAEREINIPRRYPPLMMQFPGLICKKHPPWTINRAVAADGGEDDVIINQLQPHSLPPAPGVAGLIGDPLPAATSTTFVNAYDYFWRKKPAETEHLMGKKNRSDNNNENWELGETEEKKKRMDRVVLLRGTKANNMNIAAAMLNNWCKDGRRWSSSSLRLRDPYCIATT